MNPSEPTFDASSFSKNMDRLLTHHLAELFFLEVVELAKRHKWVSDQHFSIDGTLIEAWASPKSFRPKDEADDDSQGPGGWSDFKGESRSNAAHVSKTDSEAKLLKKSPGAAAKLCFGVHAIMVPRSIATTKQSAKIATGCAC